MLTEDAISPHDAIFWEMNDPTAVRRGQWKLVINGQLVEGVPPEDAVHLADLGSAEGEWRNLRDAHPDIVRELQAMAEAWRAAIETRLKEEWQPRIRELA